ncbi:DNA ligase D [Cupriavidus consociatus]|uniref:DNA ligase D n=1 Tax=Cupriavidus consociatus TaxID=2821357 RepID=UPI001AE6883A|nr:MULTISPECIES: DNA ligase D [unclassified Cupriavidus]MBP0619430.1 DNA ligase D [Cupriavidus sp. LEh25]MDK2656078.1 DNA ligase D [Cupriavidus sp. LEh21]
MATNPRATTARRRAAERPDSLQDYQHKRNFHITPEPAGIRRRGKAQPLRFVVQKHWARRLHYDFRLELDGVLLSWAVPKGPSYDPAEKRIAIHVEDHPLDYADFEGEIPPKQYGAGSVIVWDRGTWAPVGDARDGMAAGKLVFDLFGEKLAGRWELVRIARPGDQSEQWILFKKRDAWARPLSEFDVLAALPDSVIARPLGALNQSGQGPVADAAEAIRHAPRAPLPARLAPQLATPSPTLPDGAGWIIETKFDGYRILARIDDARVTLFTRNGHDWTRKLGSLAAEIETLDISQGWLDGEIVVLRDGMPDFNALQNAIDGQRHDAIVFFAFDLPYWEGRDLRDLPLTQRREKLATLVGTGSDRVRFSEAFEAPAAQMFQAACQLGLEGLMFKRADAAYVSARTQSWLKIKCKLRQEFVIGGFSDREGSKTEIGRLHLGVYGEGDKAEGDKGDLLYVGGVGTGWDSEMAAKLHKRLAALQVDDSPFSNEARGSRRWGGRRPAVPRWVKPTLVAEVEFSDWTPDGQVRHASFKGLRTDRPARSIRREAVQTAVTPHGMAAIKVTNPERVIDSSRGITKVELVRYYESVASMMLPHLADRPLSLVRAPEGIDAPTFFQKHAETAMPGLTERPASLWPGHGALLTADSAEAIVAAAQMNVVEFHTWNSTARQIDRPDRVIFDLDPGEGVPWESMLEAAMLVHTLLDELGLQSWLKTSGGKGLHVVVPLAPRRSYDEVKAFSRAAVQHLAATLPRRFTARPGAANRKGRIFVDYLRNGFSQTTAAAFSARARPGLGVSMPVSWEQLGKLKSGAQWTIRDAREYLSFQVADPWQSYWDTRQTLTAAIERLS